MKLTKKRGTLDQLAIPLFTICITFFLVSVYINSNGETVRLNQVDMLAREYILKMESVGYLNDTDKDGLLNSLDKLNIKSVNLSGTTLTKVGYGKQIKLKFTGETNIKSYELKNLFMPKKQTIRVIVNREKTSTAKH